MLNKFSVGERGRLLGAIHCARIPGRCSGDGRNELRPYKSPAMKRSYSYTTAS